MKKLSDYTSMIVLSIKNANIEGEKEFIKSCDLSIMIEKENIEFLEPYKHIIFACHKFSMIDLEYLTLRDINGIIEKAGVEMIGEDELYKKVYNDIFNSITYTGHFKNMTILQRQFYSLIHIIRQTSVLDDNKNSLYEFDYSFMEKKSA